MATVTLKGAVFRRAVNPYGLNEFIFLQGDIRSFNEFVFVCAHELTFEDRDTSAEQVAFLRSEERDAMAEFETKVTAIRAHINSLLAIENEVKS